MIDPQISIHISPVGANWEVETEQGTLGQAETREEALELGRELAAAHHAGRIAVHGADGQIVQELTVKPEAEASDD